MTYTPIILFILSIIGVLLHNLIKLDRINRKEKGNINLVKYFQLERFTIFISIIVSAIAAFILHSEMQSYLDKFAKYFGTGFVMLGYFAQSILVVIMGKAEKFVNDKKKEDI